MTKKVKTQKKSDPTPAPIAPIAIEPPTSDVEPILSDAHRWEKVLRTNGIAGLLGVEDLIIKKLPNAKANDDVKYPVVDGEKFYTVKDLVELLEPLDASASENLWKAFKRNERRTGITIIALLKILESEV